MRRCVRVEYSIFLWFVIGICALGACGARPGQADEDGVKAFRDQVKPILEKHCIRCHNSVTRKGDLALDTRSALEESGVVEPGDVDSSLLVDAVTSDDVDERMPKDARPLPPPEIDVLRKWIAGGAGWPDGVRLEEVRDIAGDWWSLQPLANVRPPDTLKSIQAQASRVAGAEGVADKLARLAAGWNDNPIDRFLFAKLLANGLTPSPPAGRRELIRRVTYDLIGLPPTSQEVRAFVEDRSARAYDKVVDRLLASPRYGEQWGRHWLDVVRFGESNGYERNVIINNAWPYRDYVIRSFNDDKPYDQFVREQLAGDVIGSGDPAVEVGTTFLVCGPYDNVGNQDAAQAAQIRANAIDEMIRATSETFLGLTIGCARCHNHKFDPIMQSDYYGLYATFTGVHHGSRELATEVQRRERLEKLKPLNEQRAGLLRKKAELERVVRERAKQEAEQLERQWVRPVVQRTGTTETFPACQARFVRLVCEGLDTNPRARSGFRIDEFEVWSAGQNSRNVALASGGAKATGASRVAQDFADAYGPQLTIDGQFGARWLATGPELTIELPDTQRIERVVFSSDRSGAAGKHSIAAFVCEYRVEVSMDGKEWHEVANSRDRQPINAAHRQQRLFNLVITADERKQRTAWNGQIGAVDREIAAVKPPPSWWIGQFREAKGPFNVFLGGNPQRKGDAVVPASLATLTEVTHPYKLASDGPESQRRLALANWIVADDNPLTARVLANRVWHYHFGTGIVDTPSDFGAMGGRPTHPLLLDWLARRLITDNAGGSADGSAAGFGWRLKPLHKLIVMSQAYRQSAAFRADCAQRDAASRYLWRFPPRRLSAEEIRDSMLYISNKLDLKMGGPGFRLYRYLEDNVATYVPLDKHGPKTYRRSVYHQNARAAPVDLMSEFDSPDCAFAAPRRASTTTPLQALTMMNHSFTLVMAQALTERIKRDVGTGDVKDQVLRAFALAYGRSPGPQELEEVAGFATQYGLPAFCRVLLNTNEFIYLD